MYKKIFILAIIGVLIYSCSDSIIDSGKPGNLNNLQGYWINGTYNDTIVTFARATALANDQFSFGFEANGKFLENANSGWCGTPPIAYTQYEGEWSVQDSVISITVPYWGGMAHLKWKITTLDENHLSYYAIESNYEEN